MKILLDAFGGDNAPAEIVKGAIEALAARSDFSIGLVGKKAETENELKKYKYDAQRVEVIAAPDVITCDEEPTAAVRNKPQSSMCVAFALLKEGKADAFVSAGATGALLVGSMLKVGRIRGVLRPALCPMLPTVKGDKRVLLLDSGANADCKPQNLEQFAVMGVSYAQIALGVDKPRVALLSNGTEDKKGNLLNHEAFPLLSALENVDFVGNVEAREIMSGDYDVIVADGFSGNIALKSMEGAVANLMKVIKGEITASFKGKIAGLMLKKSFRNIKHKLDYNNHGGALFIGVDKVIVKAHGSAGSTAIRNSLLQAAAAVSADLVSKIKERLGTAVAEDEN